MLARRMKEWKNETVRMMGWKCSGGTFAMDQQPLGAATNLVLLDFGNVVTDIIDHVHV